RDGEGLAAEREGSGPVHLDRAPDRVPPGPHLAHRRLERDEEVPVRSNVDEPVLDGEQMPFAPGQSGQRCLHQPDRVRVTVGSAKDEGALHREGESLEPGLHVDRARPAGRGRGHAAAPAIRRFSERAYGGRAIPWSETIAVIRREGVTSNAGLATLVPSGAIRTPSADPTSSGGRSSTTMPAPDGVPGSNVETGAAT